MSDFCLSLRSNWWITKLPKSKSATVQLCLPVLWGSLSAPTCCQLMCNGMSFFQHKCWHVVQTERSSMSLTMLLGSTSSMFPWMTINSSWCHPMPHVSWMFDSSFSQLPEQHALAWEKLWPFDTAFTQLLHASFSALTGCTGAWNKAPAEVKANHLNPGFVNHIREPLTPQCHGTNRHQSWQSQAAGEEDCSVATPWFACNWLCTEHPHAGLTGSWLIHKRCASQRVGLVATSPTLHK